jgi:hypothetical protein
MVALFSNNTNPVLNPFTTSFRLSVVPLDGKPESNPTPRSASVYFELFTSNKNSDCDGDTDSNDLQAGK